MITFLFHFVIAWCLIKIFSFTKYQKDYGFWYQRIYKKIFKDDDYTILFKILLSMFVFVVVIYLNFMSLLFLKPLFFRQKNTPKEKVDIEDVIKGKI